jgi:hypothetical protein
MVEAILMLKNDKIKSREIPAEFKRWGGGENHKSDQKQMKSVFS